MPPIPVAPQALHADYLTPNTALSEYLTVMREQWSNPRDVLSILMIVGGDIVQRAVAQLAGTGPGPFAPVAFSFGWVAHSISMLASAIGDGRLLPSPDCPSVFVHAQSGYPRTNQSWVLGRLLRDEEHNLEHSHLRVSGDTSHHSGLTIAFYHSSGSGEIGFPARDWVYWAGAVVILAQLTVASVPFFLHGNWVVFLVTLAGTLLACVGSALPQWRREKYAARPVKKREVTCLTRGNGAPVVMVFRVDRGLRLEDLAGGKLKHRHVTLVATATLCVLWILLLLTVQGLDGDAWYLFGIGALGMVQNVLAAGARRSPHALGFNIERGVVINREKVMEALKEAEGKEPGVGLCLVPIFFPGTLREDEQQWWDARRNMKDKKQEVSPGNMKRGAGPEGQRGGAVDTSKLLSSVPGERTVKDHSHTASSASSITARSISPSGQLTTAETKQGVDRCPVVDTCGKAAFERVDSASSVSQGRRTSQIESCIIKPYVPPVSSGPRSATL